MMPSCICGIPQLTWQRLPVVWLPSASDKGKLNHYVGLIVGEALQAWLELQLPLTNVNLYKT